MTLSGAWSETELTPFSADNMNACLLQVDDGPPGISLLGFEGQRYFDNVAKEMYRDNGSVWEKIIEADGNANVPGLRSLTEDGGAAAFTHVHTSGPSELTGAEQSEIVTVTTNLDTDNVTDYPTSPVNPWPTSVGTVTLTTPNTTNADTSKLVLVDIDVDFPGGSRAGSDILDDGGQLTGSGFRLGAEGFIVSSNGDNIYNGTGVVCMAGVLNYDAQFILRAYPVWNLPEVSPVLSTTARSLFLRFTYRMKVIEIVSSLV